MQAIKYFRCNVYLVIGALALQGGPRSAVVCAEPGVESNHAQQHPANGRAPFNVRPEFARASEHKRRALEACAIPVALGSGAHTRPHTTADTAWYGAPKGGSSFIRSLVKALNGTDSDMCDRACVVASRRQRVIFARDPVARFISGWSEAEGLCAHIRAYSTGGGSWKRQHWGEWHRTATGTSNNYEDRVVRGQERFDAFVAAFFRWNSTRPEDFPPESGICTRGVERLKSHLNSQLLYVCSYAVHGTARNCGEDLEYIGDVATMSDEVFDLTGYDSHKIHTANKAAGKRFSDRRSFTEDRPPAHRGATVRDTQRIAAPQFPKRYLPALCRVLRRDFCCLGFQPPTECPGLCSEEPRGATPPFWLSYTHNSNEAKHYPIGPGVDDLLPEAELITRRKYLRWKIHQ